MQYNTTNTPAIVTEMTANSTGFIPNTAHYVSVTAVINTANGTLRSEPDSVIITTGGSRMSLIAVLKYTLCSHVYNGFTYCSC